MITFENLEELNTAFRNSEVEQFDTLKVDDVEFTLADATTNTIMEMKMGSPSILVMLNENNTQAITFIWKVINNTITPIKVISDDVDVRCDETQTVDYECDIKFHGLGGVEERAKIDTGAGFSSLHATNIEILNDVVKFTSPFTGKTTQMMITGHQNVRSADGGVEARPLVTFDVTIDEGKRCNKVQFNLNDRSKMKFKVLIGKNLIDAADLVIDPDNKTISEEVQELLARDMATILGDEISDAERVSAFRDSLAKQTSNIITMLRDEQGEK